jgi:hypothetical protein
VYSFRLLIRQDQSTGYSATYLPDTPEVIIPRCRGLRFYWRCIIIKINMRQLSSIPKQALFYGISSGGLYAFTNLSLREASLILNLPLLLSASVTLVSMLILQSAICFAIIKKTKSEQFIKIKSHRKTAWFIGC